MTTTSKNLIKLQAGYPGCKSISGFHQMLINNIPAHAEYHELCAGSGYIGKILYNARPDSKYFLYDIVPEVVEKFKVHRENFIYTCRDGIEVLREIKERSCKEIFTYVDPPYLMNERRNGRKYYKKEWSDNDHIDFLHSAKELKSPMMISGYESSLYNEILQTWSKLSIVAATRKGVVKECVWLNYDPEKTPLHTYDFLGEDFTDRQRIKRRYIQMVKKFEAISFHERTLLLRKLMENFPESIVKNI